MARVFRGKMVIPGNHMEAYFEALEQFEHDKAPMRRQLEQGARDFERALAQQYAPKTVRKHMSIIALFVADCNRNPRGLQSARFWDRIICRYRPAQDHIICL
jgi:hypothetical protein